MTVVSPPLVAITEPSAVARKRRREILHSQRSAMAGAGTSLLCLTSSLLTVNTTDDLSIGGGVTPETDNTQETVPPKKRKIAGLGALDALDALDSHATTEGTVMTITSNTSKKPQLRYDPDVLMSKEATAAWRRDQRRKRNRESAAASRQRQRDRINELEEEVEVWKVKFEEVMGRLRELESSHARILTNPKTLTGPCKHLIDEKNQPKSRCVISPYGTPTISPQPSPDVPSPSPLEMHRVQEGSEYCEKVVSHVKAEEKECHLNEMISRPA